MRTIWFWTIPILALGCSTAASNGTTSGAATTSSEGSSASGGSSGANGTSTGGGTSAGSTGGSTTSGGSTGTTATATTGGNICGIVLDAGMIGICDKAFFPDNINVHLGDTIQVINGDGYPHTVTSTDAPGDFDKVNLKKANGGWTFDTGLVGTYVSDAGKVTIWVPTDAGVTVGVIQPFFCKQHQAMMVGDPNPTITVIQ